AGNASPASKSGTLPATRSATGAPLALTAALPQGAWIDPERGTVSRSPAPRSSPIATARRWRARPGVPPGNAARTMSSRNRRARQLRLRVARVAHESRLRGARQPPDVPGQVRREAIEQVLQARLAEVRPAQRLLGEDGWAQQLVDLQPRHAQLADAAAARAAALRPLGPEQLDLQRARA